MMYSHVYLKINCCFEAVIILPKLQMCAKSKYFEQNFRISGLMQTDQSKSQPFQLGMFSTQPAAVTSASSGLGTFGFAPTTTSSSLTAGGLFSTPASAAPSGSLFGSGIGTPRSIFAPTTSATSSIFAPSNVQAPPVQQLPAATFGTTNKAFSFNTASTGSMFGTPATTTSSAAAPPAFMQTAPSTTANQPFQFGGMFSTTQPAVPTTVASSLGGFGFPATIASSNSTTGGFSAATTAAPVGSIFGPGIGAPRSIFAPSTTANSSIFAPANVQAPPAQQPTAPSAAVPANKAFSFNSASSGSIFGSPATTVAPVAAAPAVPHTVPSTTAINQPFQLGMFSTPQPAAATSTSSALSSFGFPAATTTSNLRSEGTFSIQATTAAVPAATVTAPASSIFGPGTGAASSIFAPTTNPAGSIFASATTAKAHAFATPPTTTTSAPAASQSAFAPTATLQFSKPSQPQPATTTATAPPTAQGFTLGTLTSTAVPAVPTIATAFAPVASTTAASLPLSLSLPLTATTVQPTPVAVSAPSTTTTQPVGAVTTEVAKQPLTYQQLEDLVNKWTGDLEEQERTFLTQATQINAWDRILNENGEKILQLNDSVVTLENEQQRVDHELDFVGQQQQELDQILQKLEQTLIAEDIFTGGGAYAPHSDVQREQMIQLQVNLDSQMKQIGQELSQIVDRVNVLTDSNCTDDPMKQIAQVLSKQMDALQWIDEQTNVMQTKAQEMKTSIDDRRKQSQTSRLYGGQNFSQLPRNVS